jgi:hypothetical protein
MDILVTDIYGNKQWLSSEGPTITDVRNAVRECAGLPPKTLIEEVHEVLDQLLYDVHRQIARDASNAKRAIRRRAKQARLPLLAPAWVSRVTQSNAPDDVAVIGTDLSPL